MILVPLDRIDVPNPCTVPWAEMRGTDRVRHCGHCRQSVYDLSAMTRAEAEALIRQTEGRLCVSFFRRPDGTVKTARCGRAARFAGRTVTAAVGILAGLTLAVFGGCAVVGGGSRSGGGNPWYREFEPFRTIAEWFDPQSARLYGGACLPPLPMPPAEVAPEPHEL